MTFKKQTQFTMAAAWLVLPPLAFIARGQFLWAFALLCVLALLSFLHEPFKVRRKELFTATVSAVGMGALCYMLFRTYGDSSPIALLLMTLGVVAIGAYIYRVAKKES